MRPLGLSLLAVALLCAASACSDLRHASAGEKLRTGGSGVVLRVSVGVETLGGIFTPLVPVGSELPASYSAIFSTAADNQPQVEVHLLAGSAGLATHNKSLGRFRISGIRPAPRGVPQIEVSVHIDTAGRVSVAARDLDASNASRLTVSHSGANGELLLEVGPK